MNLFTNVYIVSFGELMLKGKNRNQFVKRAVRQIRKVTKNLGVLEIYEDRSKIILSYEDNGIEILEELKKIFGVAVIIPGLRVDKEMESIEKAAREIVRRKGNLNGLTFKAEVQRADKSFEPKSPQMAAHMGGIILKEFGKDLSVDVRSPDFVLFVDIRDYVYLSTESIPGLGGLPVGSSGKGLVLLSGGIDSPVSAFQMAKRGVYFHGVHFHAFPYTPQQSIDKIVDLSHKLVPYNGNFKIYSVNLLKIYQSIQKACNPRYMTIIARRMMMRIAENLSEKNDFQMLITGDSLGQVASQTIEGIQAIEDATNSVILRPLIAMDKREIIDIAKMIDTYEISIQPFADCCLLFSPDNPITKPSIKRARKEESKIDVEKLVKEAIEEMEIINVKEEI